MADLEDYLQEGFDPRSVTMPRLRSILVTHNIDYPSTAKKAQLVSLVEEQVLPQASRLRAQREKAHRTSFGIINAGGPEDVSRLDEDDELAPPTRATRPAKSPRKSSARIKVEDDDHETPVATRAKRTSRQSSRQPSHVEDDEPPVYEAPKSSRRGRRTITPQIKAESEEEDSSLAPVGEESVFTDDNPFQSGSSPPQQRTPSHRRRTTSGEAIKSAKSSRRRTDGDVHRSRKSKSFEPPSPPLHDDDSESSLEPEEFTAEEQLELEEAASQGDPVALSHMSPRKTRKTSRGTNVTTPLFVLFLALFGAYLAWYRQEKIAVGYCGLGRPAKELLPPDVPVPEALVPFIEPTCTECPQHAICHSDFTVRCEPDFVVKPHPLSFGGLVPLPPTCEPDGEKARRVQAVADKAVEELRDRRAKFECGELVDEAGVTQDSPAIAEEELKETVSRKRNKRLNRDEFDDLWAAAIGDVTKRDEVEVTKPPTSNSTDLSDRRLSSTSLARLPFTCSFKRSVRLGLERNRLSIGLLVTTILSFFYGRSRYRRHRATSAQVPALVDLVLGRLSNQKALGEEDVDDPWLFLPNLRDDVLRSVHSLSERERIWRKVKGVVEHNSNVRTSQRVGRSGEVGRAWEWVGPVAGEGVRRRRSAARVSFGPDVKSDSSEREDMSEIKKWEESRPAY